MARQLLFVVGMLAIFSPWLFVIVRKIWRAER